MFNWYDYIDEDVLRDFEKETGIRVRYTCFTTVEEMYAKMSNGAGDYDVIFPSDYMIERMIREGSLAELDMAGMENLGTLQSWLQAPDYDPEGKYSVPYMWGTVGILYDPDRVEGGEITSWSSLFDPAYQKDVFMLDSIRDCLGVTLKYLGYSMNTREEAQLEEAKQVLIQQKADGIVKGYLVDEVKDKMIAGEAAMAVMWSGDALYSIEEDDHLRYVVPEEGSNVWVDAMCVPASSQHKEAAEMFIDFLCRPEVAQRNYDYIHYYSPSQAVLDDMSQEDRDNPELNPPAEILERCEFFHDIADDIAIYDKIWVEIRG